MRQGQRHEEADLSRSVSRLKHNNKKQAAKMRKIADDLNECGRCLKSERLHKLSDNLRHAAAELEESGVVRL